MWHMCGVCSVLQPPCAHYWSVNEHDTICGKKENGMSVYSDINSMKHLLYTPPQEGQYVSILKYLLQLHHTIIVLREKIGQSHVQELLHGHFQPLFQPYELQ